MQVTVLVSFDRAAFVERTVRSLLEQTHRDLEVVVLARGTDDTAGVVRRAFGGSVQVLCTPGATIPRARNAALASSRAPFVALASADTPCAPERIARQLAAFEGRPRAGLCHSDASFIDEDGRPATLPAERRLAPRQHREGHAAAAMLLEGNPVLGASVMLRRSVLDLVGLFDETPGLSWDFDLWVRVAAVSEVVFVPEPLIAYRALTFAIPDDGPARATERHLAALQKHATRTAHALGVAPSALRRRRRDLLVELAVQHLREGSSPSARRALLRALTTAAPTPQAVALLAASLAPAPALHWARAARRAWRR